MKVDNLDSKEAITKVQELLNKKESSYAVTVNPEFIITAQKDLEFKKILNNASISLADGVGLVWASWVFGNKLKQRITGTDFVYEVAKLANQKGYTLFLLGGGLKVAELSGVKLKEQFPNLKVVGTSSADPDQALPEIKAKKIDILLVAYGHPKQEKWIANNLSGTKVKLAIGVGGALDYISGKKIRAPIFIRRIGLEWLFRLVSQPWRIRRQLSLPYFAYLVLKEKFS